MAQLSHITSTNELRSASVTTGQLGRDFSTTLGQMNGIIQRIDAIWDGPASEDFKSKYAYLKNAVSKYEADLLQYKNFLDEAARNYETTDNTVAQGTSALQKTL